MKKWLSWILVAIFAAWFFTGIKAPSQKDGFDVAGFGRLPVLLNGRVQPFDSVARNTLLSMQGKSTVRAGDKTLCATEWLLEAMTRPQLADQRPIFRLQHPDLEGLLGSQKTGLQYFCFNDVTNQLEQIGSQVETLVKSEGDREDAASTRTLYQKDLMHLYNSLLTYRQIKNSLQPEDSENFVQEVAAFQGGIAPALAAAKKEQAGQDYDKEALKRIMPLFQRFQEMAGLAYPLAVPPAAGQPAEAWRNVGTGLVESLHTGEVHPAVKYLAAMAASYAGNRPQEFNQAVAGYRAWPQANNLLPALEKGEREFFFNQLEPFYKAMVIYVAALILGCAFWINLSEPVRKAGFALLVLAFVVHTFGLAFRMYLEGRPPVTNLYSSAVFIGWGAVGLGLVLERLFRGAIGLVVSGVIGFVTLIIAHHLAQSGDTMEMLRAVLDTNLWLATHVVAVTIGYASMFVAGILAIIYILRGFFTQSLTPELGKGLTRMVYGIICFSTLFSFTGTVLGGIWADQSWGRFWGWDPKENGALLIVLWNAIILHARWGKLVGERGLMAMAVFGNIITSFSWFGVNMLGVGLHAYGFMDAAFPWLLAFVGTQLGIITIALLPTRLWASRQEPSKSIAAN